MTGEYGTVDDGQRKVYIQVMEQAGEVESPELTNNVQIVDGEIPDLPRGLPAGSPITVTFHLKEDGTLDVDAVEPSSGKLLHLEAAVREGVMSVKEVEERKEILFKTTVS
jgi:molecular chaperone DnaK (HSP70)